LLVDPLGLSVVFVVVFFFVVVDVLPGVVVLAVVERGFVVGVVFRNARVVL